MNCEVDQFKFSSPRLVSRQRTKTQEVGEFIDLKNIKGPNHFSRKVLLNFVLGSVSVSVPSRRICSFSPAKDSENYCVFSSKCIAIVKQVLYHELQLYVRQYQIILLS